MILGTHRFQRAVSAGCALENNGPSNRGYTLEAMRTQGRAQNFYGPPNLILLLTA